ncbi:SMI1/KNR4 family protein [Pectobacterium parmentieri]|uniref:SMI1/KNR4 family protein n=1 Tax=Pectobacterium parmentieri TaxID=1905730 RepID=A0ABS0S5N0_PECPM|nr:SMI1/KNR4 family protein [Pectobacterium parmentieri]AYH03392.1 SMI1/KNR4 family protein [Pectobacterium parmentieri]AYH16481.1 SMI1/KNR4 family protein [Pectobacterium parmentieri]AYH29649.1 SMI1/KNR4 family protein [Pectobacterium parmentieri]AYH34067.1 SMI1/KNR4 family protein [Pectobacterium parmentieri]MBI0473092.1 SMI1/KNR4 family protein [Pectobacterium parmentieri]
MSFIDKAEEKMKESGERIRFTGGVGEAEIKEFEALLGVFFPESYKLFLKKYGALSFCGDTYYGITQDGKEANEVPCVYFSTVDAREQGDISSSMIKIKSSGYGPSYSIDTDVTGKIGEPVVVETSLAFKKYGEKTIIADNFGEFFLNQIEEAIEQI